MGLYATGFVRAVARALLSSAAEPRGRTWDTDNNMSDQAADASLGETVHDHHGTPSLKRDLGLMLGALGVVFGDIGTSPLYAMSQSALAAGGTVPKAFAVLGALSLIFLVLIIAVT